MLAQNARVKAALARVKSEAKKKASAAVIAERKRAKAALAEEINKEKVILAESKKAKAALARIRKQAGA